MFPDSEMEKFPATERFLWQLCKTYAQEFPDPKRPVRSELVAAFVPRVVRLIVLQHIASDVLKGVGLAVSAVPESHNEMVIEAANLLQTYSRDLLSQIVELDSWLHEPDLNEMGCGNWLTDHRYAYEQASELIRRAGRYQPGRPPTKRLITVAALDAQRLDGSRSWSKLAAQFCDCGKQPHDDRCREALRKSGAQLQAVLRKYRKLPVPADLIGPLASTFLDRLGWGHSS
jgi:hypothetical protein